MKRNSLILAAVAATLAAPVALPAFADGVNPGTAMQAQILGVTPGAYSASELGALDTAYRDDDAQAVAYILAGGLKTDRVSSSGTTVSEGDAMFAKILGLTPGAYSIDEMQRIELARQHGDVVTEQALLDHATSSSEKAGLGVVSGGKAQLAASLGIDNPADYTLAQLAALDTAKTGEND